MNLQSLANQPIFRLSNELQSKYGHWLNSPTYQLQARFSAICEQMAQLQRLQGTLPECIENPEYYERLAELIQVVVEIDNDIREKVDEVEPVVKEYNPLLIDRLKKDCLPIIRDFVIWAYSNTDIDELRYMLPDAIAKDLMRFAKERASYSNLLFDEVNKLDEIAKNSHSSLSVVMAQPSTFNELIPDEEKRHFVEQAMKDFQITDTSGRCCLQPKKRAKLLAFIRACHNTNIFNYYPDSVLINIFSQYINTDATKLDARSKVYDKTYDEVKSYIEKRIPRIPEK